MKNALSEMQTIVLLGGTSDIGRAIVKQLATSATDTIVLAGRSPAEIDTESLAAPGRAVHAVAFDATEPKSHVTFADEIYQTYGDVDAVIVAFGMLGDQAQFDDDPVAAAEAVTTNFAGAVSSTLAFTKVMRAQRHGHVVILSSVAGERARASNFVYGSTKAGLDAFAQGLRDSLLGTGVDVTVVRPGFVYSKMTAGLDAAPLATTPEKVAEYTVAGMRAGKHTVWAPPALRLLFATLRHLPRPIFTRLPI